MFSSLDRHKPKICKRFELDIRSRFEGVQEELKLLVMAFRLNLNDIVEVTLCICFKGNVHFDSQSCCKWSLHVVFNLKLRRLGISELESSHSLADVSDCDSDLVVLVWLNV